MQCCRLKISCELAIDLAGRTFLIVARESVLERACDDIPYFDGRVIGAADADPAVCRQRADSLSVPLQQVHVPRVLVRADLDLVARFVKLPSAI